MQSDAFRRGTFVTLGTQWGKYAVQLLAIVLLARLLNPDDYGLVAMSAAITGFAAVIGDFGLSLAALQAATLSQAQKSNLFWLNAGIGTATAAVIAAIAPLLAVFYGEPRLTLLTIALAGVFVLNGLSVQFRVEINRKLQFAKLGLIELFAQLAGLVGAVIMALLDFSYWSLVGQQLISATVGLVLFVSVARWWPGLPETKAGMRGLVTFGRDTFAVQIASYTTTNLDSVLIGRQFGADVLGVYNRAFQLIMLPIQQIVSPLTRVFLPKLSTIADDAPFNATLQKLQLVLAYTMVAPLSLLASTADWLLPVVLGEQWAEASGLVKILAVGGVFQAIGYIYYWAFLARSRTKLLFLSELCGRIPMVILMLVLLPFGVEWVAVAVIGGQFLIWLSTTSYFGGVIGIRTQPLVSAAMRPMALFSLAFVASWLASQSDPLRSQGDVVTLLACSAVWLAVCAAACLIIPAYKRDVHTYLATIRPRR